MSLRFPRQLLAVACAVLAWGTSVSAADLRICADPNNLPFSNDRLEGFENEILALVAHDLGLTPVYTWRAQRRGFLRETLRAGRCDVVAGLPVGIEGVALTRPYYRSAYAFVTRQGSPMPQSLDDPLLRRVTVGLQLVGDDGHNTPPADALARRGISGNLRGYHLYADYAFPNPPARVVEAVAAGDVDVAIAWGPTAGYFAARSDPPLAVAPVKPEIDGAEPMAFDLAVGVRKDNLSLRDDIDRVLERRRGEIEAILHRYSVPVVAPRSSSLVEAP